MISILVAAYNAAAYLPRCLTSLAAQTYDAFEVLCVDDASTDNTAAIIAAWCRRDPRFRLFTLPANRGQAVARNYALQHAQGDIVMMVDADDWLSEDALTLIADTFAQHPLCDCAVLRLIMVSESGKEEDYGGEMFTVLSGRAASFLSLTWRIHGFYAARRALYDQYPYDDSCHLYSDDNTTHIHYYASREVRSCAARYYYYQHALSATHRVSTEKMHWLSAAASLCRQLKELGCDDEMRAVAATQQWRVVVDCYYYYYKHRSSFSPADRAYCLSALRHALTTIDLTLVDKALLRRFGYMPLHQRWGLFRCEEEVYFLLRQLAGRN